MRPVTLVAAAALLGAAAPQPMRLQPSSPWILDDAEGVCKLNRAFGEDADKTVLQFESTAPGELSIIAIGRPLQTKQDEVPTRFLPVQDKTFNGAPRETVTKKPVILWSEVNLLPAVFVERDKFKKAQRKDHPEVRPPPIDLEEREAVRAARQAFAEAAVALEIDTSRRKPVILETGTLGAAIKMFDKCSRDLLRDWGVDPDVEDKIVRDVWAPDPSRWFSSNDYPAEMRQQMIESEVRVRLLVNAAGDVTKCTSLSHYNEPAFKEGVCDKFMKRAKFEPAELADGTKVPSYYVSRMVFRMDH